MAFCPHCGAPVDEGARFCTSCGAQLAAAPATPTQVPNAYPQGGQAAQRPQNPQGAPYPQPQPTPQQPAYSANSTGAAANLKYQQLGGWLLFFVICWGLSVFSAAGNILDTLGSLGRVLSYGLGSRLIVPSMLSVLSNLLSGALSVLMIVLIVKRNHMFLRLYQILTFVEIGLSILSGITSSGSGAVAIGYTVGLTVGGAVGLFLMTMYFCKSERVRTYMGSTAYLDQALFKVGVN